MTDTPRIHQYTQRLLQGSFALCILFLLTTFAPLSAQTITCQQPGQTLRETYTSTLLGQGMTYSIYLPPCYDANQTYPALYLLHGSNEDDQQWQRLGLLDALDERIQMGITPPMIVLMPFGNVIANRNRFDTISWANIFMTEFMPHVESRYAISPARQNRAIGGISRGGFWAYHIGLTHPDQFATIGGHSAFFDLHATPPEVNPLHLVTTITLPDDLRLWLDRGADDFARSGLDQMHQRLNQRNIPHIYTVHPTGEHNALYWSTHIADYIDFYTTPWQIVYQHATPSTPRPNIQQPTFGQPATPTPSPSSEAIRLYLPLTGAQSLRTNITTADINTVIRGDHHPDLILTQSTYDALIADGFTLSQQTRIIAPDALIPTLAREHTQNRFTLAPFDAIPPTTRLLLLDGLSLFDQLHTYPLALSPTPQPNFTPSKLTRISLSGVTALTRNTRVALQTTPIETATSGIAPYVTSADFFHISNEVSFVDNCPDAPDLPRLGGASSFCAQWQHAPLLDALQVDIIELTGNHNNDYGYDAYAQTLTYYQEHGFMTVGAGMTPQEARTPLQITHNGNHFTWLACNTIGPYYALVNDDPDLLGGVRGGALPCDWAWLEQTVPQLAQTTDILIITLQHQEFETYLPTDQQRFDFRRLAQWGADVVVGTAPHKPQIFEWHTTPTHDAFLHYGLGNLYFDQPFWGNRRFFIDTLILYDAQLLTLELFTGIIDDNVRPRPMTDEERFNFMFFLLVEQQ